MAKITFVQPDGSKQTITADTGMTAMEAAKKHLVNGIEAECGGACACATCHVYVDAGWREKVGKPTEMEEDMLDFAFDVREESRLACQIRVKDELDGLVLNVPAKQF
jgi:ferredoxin, 2Fe-2S